MLKGNGKNIIAIIAIITGTLVVVIFGVWMFHPTIPYDVSFTDKQQIKLFDEFKLSQDRENWLIPIGTFFSALSALATVYLIWLQQQTIKKHDLDVYTERVISHFFILLDKHRIIINNMKFTFDDEFIIGNKVKPASQPAIGYDAIKSCVYTLRIALSNTNYIDINHQLSKDDYRYLKSYKVIEKVCNIKKNEDFSCIEYFEYIIKNTFDILDEHTLYFINQYFSNIYIMIKLLNENKYIINISDYMETLRSELTYDEFILIYYYAFTYKKDGKKIFKNLIEETNFFYNLYKEVIDCDPDTIDSEEHRNGIPFKLYDTSTFNHN